ncbi:hypothetical protein Nepgr_006919 [Nepenthes gracilis]|uniref:65-kDa microtubule-associated protein 5 n=1 Tax=Nepenthes gracilis TaxID=150966 RepID=A0AAD3S691_NEPGR|nr:hypothetical protein Nepgr_006919 [Nepenthes gracilis]
MLLELEQECLDIYRRKVENTRKYKADLYQALAEGQAEIAHLISSLGELTSFSRERGTLKEQLSAIKPVLEELRLKKQARIKDFSETQSQIICLCAEVAGNGQLISNSEPQVDVEDLTIKRLAELKSQLGELQNEKVLRLQKVNGCISNIHELSIVMSIDFKGKINEIHPSLVDPGHNQSKSISNETLAKLTSLVNSLKQEKQNRLQKIQYLGSALVELWNLLDTSIEEQKRFQQVTSMISSSADEVLGHGSLSFDVIERAEIELERLNVLKASKMKEFVLKRQNELEEIYREVHMDIDGDGARQILISLIESGNVDLSDLLSRMDDQIRKAKEEAHCRKDILERVEKWKHASEEEDWLDEYEKDENRYSAGKGVHKNLKRAEKARILASKMPSLVENLTLKVKAWEADRGRPFLYDKTHLLHNLEEYALQRRQKEEEKRKAREQKRLQEQLVTEKEALFGSRPATKKPLAQSDNTNTAVGTPTARRAATPSGRISGSRERRDGGKVGAGMLVNYVALPKDDAMPRGS